MTIQKLRDIQDKYFYILENLKTDKLRQDDHVKTKEKDLKIALSSEAYADLGIIKDFLHYLEINLTCRVKDYQYILTYKKFFDDFEQAMKDMDIYKEIEMLLDENKSIRAEIEHIKAEYLIKEAKLMQAQAAFEKQKGVKRDIELMKAPIIKKPVPIIQQEEEEESPEPVEEEEAVTMEELQKLDKPIKEPSTAYNAGPKSGYRLSDDDVANAIALSKDYIGFTDYIKEKHPSAQMSGIYSRYKKVKQALEQQ